MLEFTFSTMGSFTCKIHYKAHLFNKSLGAGRGSLNAGVLEYKDIVAFDFGFVSLFSGFRVRKSCSFIFHVAVFLSWLLKEAGLMKSCC